MSTTVSICCKIRSSMFCKLILCKTADSQTMERTGKHFFEFFKINNCVPTRLRKHLEYFFNTSLGISGVVTSHFFDCAENENVLGSF